MSYQYSTHANRSHLTAGGRQQRGFTLIEVMIVAAVVAILGMIAYPSYMDSVRKSRRAEAKSALSDLAARQEQFFNDNKTYADTTAKLNMATTTPSGYYNLQIAAGATGTLASSYLMTATATGIQMKDTKCATFTYASSGKKDSTPAGNTCW